MYAERCGEAYEDSADTFRTEQPNTCCRGQKRERAEKIDRCKDKAVGIGLAPEPSGKRLINKSGSGFSHFALLLGCVLWSAQCPPDSEQQPEQNHSTTSGCPQSADAPEKNVAESWAGASKAASPSTSERSPCACTSAADGAGPAGVARADHAAHLEGVGRGRARGAARQSRSALWLEGTHGLYLATLVTLDVATS